MTQRQLLPLLPSEGGPHGNRSFMTCKFRCADACYHPAPNTSGNPEFRDVAEQALRRRSLLKAGGVGLGALAVTGLSGPAPAVAAPAPAPQARGRGRGRGRAGRDRFNVGRDDFGPVPPNRNDAVTTPRGYRSDVVIRWGDPVTKRAPRFDVNRQTPDAQYEQFGYNCDYVGVLPTSRNAALLVVNHEYTNEEIMFPAGTDETLVKEVAMAAHGMSVVEIRRGKRQGSYETVPVQRTRRNRRISLRTRFEMTGPAAGTPRLRTSRDLSGRRVFGTLNNCAGGTTPWGTVLSGEENFNQYFDLGTGADPRYAASYARYTINGVGSRGWSEVDDRFDLSVEPHEPFRFGWIVEVDPSDPTSVPQKHSMLGRFKHEGANIALTDDGRAVAYMGDDQIGDYIYKFVSKKRMRRGSSRAAKRHNLTLLHEGTLYVARFTGDGAQDGTYDGAGEWIPLCTDRQSFVPGMSVADVLIDTRLAADKMGPTKMDRPEDVEPNLVTGRVYAALTNNSQRGTTFPVDEANPLASSKVRAERNLPLTKATGNRNGYVLEMSPRGGDHASLQMDWNLMLVCGDPQAPETYFAGYPKQLVSPISCPDNVAFDAEGNLWVSTDGNVIGSNDGLFRVPTEGPERGHVEQFLTVPLRAETCGPLISEDQRSVWVAVQHPGESDDATFESPASTWPDGGFPRPSVVVAYRG
jgi:secreted PhoX family phosphatase